LQLALVVLSIAIASGVSAQSTDAKAAAESLFQEARQLMAEGKYAEACPKLESSQKLDPGVGTMLNLADCYEKNGQTASAWAQFVDAATESRKLGDKRREQAASSRATALKPRLARLTIAVAQEADVSGLSIRRDGLAIDRALWGTALPTDPGDRQIEASAPGYLPWRTSVTIADGESARAEVPALQLEPVAAPIADARDQRASSELDESVQRAVDAPPRDDDAPWYGRWYTWAGVGGVVAAGVVVAVLVAGGSDDGGVTHRQPKSGVTLEALRTTP
jgi:tetratricopeptide (TPR) repeat protein